MSDEIVFYTNPMSRGRTVRWMLEEVGRPYRTEIVQYGDQLKGPEYRAINPMGKLPALTHGGTVVTEVAAICAYLADAFPDAELAPDPGSHDRGPFYRWMFFAAGVIEPAVMNQALGVTVPAERERMMGYGNFGRTLDVIERTVDGTEFLAGGRFSAADLLIASQLGFGMMFGMIEKRPAFERFVALHSARPAAVRAREIDEALTPKPAQT